MAFTPSNKKVPVHHKFMKLSMSCIVYCFSLDLSTLSSLSLSSTLLFVHQLVPLSQAHLTIKPLSNPNLLNSSLSYLISCPNFEDKTSTIINGKHDELEFKKSFYNQRSLGYSPQIAALLNLVIKAGQFSFENYKRIR